MTEEEYNYTFDRVQKELGLSAAEIWDNLDHITTHLPAEALEYVVCSGPNIQWLGAWQNLCKKELSVRMEKIILG